MRRLLPLLLLAMLSACDLDGLPVVFEPAEPSIPNAAPGFSSSVDVVLRNDSPNTWRLTDLAVSEASAETDGVFEAMLAAGVSLPVELAPEATLQFLVVFSPQEAEQYEATLTAALQLVDFRVGGGGCSAGCGSEAPSDGTLFLTANLVATGDENAESEDCADGIDNDGDGAIDCQDDDCVAFPDCIGVELCDNGIDDDGDGAIDCDDADCTNDPACDGPGDEVCDNGVDDDGDGRIDCDDADCTNDPACVVVEGCDPVGDVNCGEPVAASTLGGQDNWSQYCDFPQDVFTGPEDVWLFVPEESGVVTVRLDSDVDHDLTVLEARAADVLSCDPESCVATAWNPPGQPEIAEFFAEEDAVYFVVVDGFNGAAGAYELALLCEGDFEEQDCGDGIDNDGDGLTDCTDPDCAGSLDCQGDGTCQPIDLAQCPQWEFSANNAQPGATNDVVDYCGRNDDGWTGPEMAFVFFAANDATVVASLTDLSDDLDLTILEAAAPGPGGPGCDPDACVAEEWQGGDNPEFVEFQAVPGVAYILVVDGWSGAVSDFTLTVECTGGPDFELECGNGFDDDGDGLADCDDPDCAFAPECQGPVEICDDGFDNDGDNFVDCVDFDCFDDPACFVEPELCFDGTDNDGDGFVDCDDFDCFFDPFCQVIPAEECGNGVDDDGDGAVDCDDPECFGDPNCASPDENCSNGADDDNDGDVDCDDSDCASAPGCQTFPETCNDGIDNDNDGAIDCADFDCAGDPSCVPGGEFFCADNLDNDNDGLVDCDDPDCAFSPVCAPGNEICNDGQDNDADGAVDCDDFDDCSAFPGCDSGGGDCCSDNGSPGCDNQLGEDCVCSFDPFCCQVEWDALCVDGFVNSCGGTCGDPDPEVDCDNGVDDDGDGFVDCNDADCFADPVCQAVPDEICGNGVDDDNDGLTDCDDPECFGDPNCVPPDEDCANGIDDDNDGDVDCDDAECSGLPICAGSDPETCDNGVDDDGDGLVDCNDADCDADPNCQGPGQEFNCTDGLDNDLDGTIDCDDADCATNPNCLPPVPEICDDGIDNDGDGDEDCDDTECTADPSCDAGDGDCCAANGSPGCSDEAGENCVCAADPFCCNVTWDALCADQYINDCGGTCGGVEICDNGLDDDSDGDVDCDDSECVFATNCLGPGNEGDCSNGVDDDSDGLVDCSDTDCFLDPACLPDPEETVCDNLVDDDNDGLFDCADPDCFADPDCVAPGTETNCANNIDDDNDGDVDCADPDCTLDPNCNVVLFETSCTDNVDNDNDGLVDCADPDCATFPACSSTGSETDCDNGIDDDADGWTDCNDSDCAFDPNCANGEFACGDGVDNDGDGLVDCDDGDCSADIECVDPGLCNPVANLSCGDVITGSNSSPGSSNTQDEYCGNPLAPGWTGPEITYLFTPDADSLVDITLTGLSADLDIQALVQDNGCDPDDCEANGWNPPPQPEQMDWYAFAGQPYYILIDGWNGAVSSFTLSVTCTPSEEQDCDDGLDDDVDGDIDCDDVDCLGNAACPEDDCDNGIDDDADGFIDCNDPDCFGTPTCVPESNCVDGIDNDADGDIDCDDPDCDAATACLPETACTDGNDNDADGDVDCDDSDCAADPFCNEEIDCTDGIDNDGDGQADCDDADCAVGPFCDSGDGDCCTPNGTPGCDDETGENCVCAIDAFCCTVTWDALCADTWQNSCGGACSTDEVCDDNTDNDNDGLVDCDDPDCLNVPICIPSNETNCSDGFDNDFDGDEDCFDSDCAGDPACGGETICDDGFDNDADTLVDCDDPDCIGVANCPVILWSSDDDPNALVHFPLGGHGSNTAWEFGVPTSNAQGGNGPDAPFEGNGSWCTGCTDVAVDGGTFEAVLAPVPFVIDLSAYPSGTLTLAFWHWLEAPGGFFIRDEASVLASPDGGTTVDEVWGPIDGSNGGWEFEEIDLTSYLGGNLTFSFYYDSISQIPSGDDGWYIDDVQLIWQP